MFFGIFKSFGLSLPLHGCPVGFALALAAVEPDAVLVHPGCEVVTGHPVPFDAVLLHTVDPGFLGKVSQQLQPFPFQVRPDLVDVVHGYWKRLAGVAHGSSCAAGGGVPQSGFCWACGCRCGGVEFFFRMMS